MHEAERPRGVNDGEKDQRKWINKCLPNCTTTLHWQNGVKLFIKKYILMASFMQSCFHKKFHFKILLSASKIFLCLLPGSFHFLFFGQNDQKRKNQLSFSSNMRIFYTENKQTGQLIFFIFDHFDQKTKNKEWNEPDIRKNLAAVDWFFKNSLKYLRTWIRTKQYAYRPVCFCLFDCLPLCFQPVEGTVAFYLVYLLALDIR